MLKRYKHAISVFGVRCWVRRLNPKCAIDSGVEVTLNSQLAKFSRLHEKVSFNDSEIGRYSYVGPNSVLNKVVIGRFCSIGANVRVVYGTHPTCGFISTSPIFYSQQGQCGETWGASIGVYFNEYKLVNGKSMIIGNDVWIGEGALLLEGIRIGNGSIVAAGSVVVKDVEDFEIVGGNPAKHIRYRFGVDDRKKIKDSQWWNAPDKLLFNNRHHCTSVSRFIDGVEY